MRPTPIVDPEHVKTALARIVETVSTDEDPDELKQYRRLFKKHVPFNLKSYVNAYLLKAAIDSGAARGTQRAGRGKPGTRGAGRGGERGGRGATATAGRRGEPAGTERPARAGKSGERRGDDRGSEREPTSNGRRRLFVSIGRNRRVQPNELTALFAETVSIDAGDFGDVKILDSYSFIEVPDAVAEQAIASLSGSNFKGRKITVDFARSKG